MALVKEHTKGTVRYFTYYLIFPGDEDVWVDQSPFVNELQFELKNTRWRINSPDVYRDLLHRGEATWKDHNGVTHRVVIEAVQRPRRWGVKRKHG